MKHFISRDNLSARLASNIKRPRAAVGPNSNSNSNSTLLIPGVTEDNYGTGHSKGVYTQIHTYT